MSTEDLLQFPCDFPIKIMGPQHDLFIETIVKVVLHHAPDFDPASVEIRTSSGSKYLGITCTIRTTSREQLDNLYRDLSSHPMVRVVL